MAECDNAIQHNFVQVWRLQPQHLEYRIFANLLGDRSNLSRAVHLLSELAAEQLLAVATKGIKCAHVGTRTDLDQFGKAVAYLCKWQSLQEAEIKECMDWGMIRSEAILVVTVIHSHFDTDASVDQSNQGCRDANEVGVAAVTGARKAGKVMSACVSAEGARCEYRSGQIIESRHLSNYPATSVTRPPPTTSTGSLRIMPKLVIASQMPRRDSIFLAFSPTAMAWNVRGRR